MTLRSATFLLLGATAAFCQAPTRPTFDVAELKPNKSNATNIDADFGKGGQVIVHNAPLRLLISEGYHIRAEQLQGAPSWTESERFDIVAKAPPTTSEEDLRRMVVTLLEDRMKLATHTDEKTMSAFALVVAKDGPKNLKQSTAARPGENRCHGVPPETPGDNSMQCEKTTMAQLAGFLGAFRGYIQMPIVDQTGIDGSFDLQFHFTPAGLLNGGVGGGVPAGSGISLFAALQEQLGLKLESKKVPMKIVVVDHIERTPTEN